MCMRPWPARSRCQPHSVRTNEAAVVGPRRAGSTRRFGGMMKRFNEAAVVGPRRGCPPAPAAPTPCGFNEAAVVGPRRELIRGVIRRMHGASMRPRSLDRGELVRHALTPEQTALQ